MSKKISFKIILPLDFILIIFLCVFFLLVSFFSQVNADTLGTNSSPNYLIILVHGINTSKAIFVGNSENGGYREPEDEKYPYGDLKGYLENQLGLNGYVYSYTFSQRDGHIELQGKELGKSDHFNDASVIGGRLNYLHADHKQLPWYVTGIKPYNSGKCWLRQARDDFKKWYANKYYNGDVSRVLESYIPQKYIIIAHSMGGLSAREYLFSDYYNNDIAALITIDTPHMGANSARMLKQIAEFDSNGKANAASLCLVLGMAASAYHLSPLDIYLLMCGVLGYGFQELVIDRFYTDSQFGWYYGQDAVKDMDVESSYIALLKDKKLKDGVDSIKIRLIASKGVPTPPKDFSNAGRFIFGLPAIQVIFSGSFWNNVPSEGKFISLWLSILFGTPINEDGDFMVQKSSQLAEGVNSFNDPRINLKKYEVSFAETNSGLNDAVEAILIAADTIGFLAGANPFLRAAIMMHGIGTLAGRIAYAKDGYLDAHGSILKRVYQDHVIDHALEDIILVGGQAPAVSSGSSRSGISAASVRTTTAGFAAPEQAFSLLSNKNRNGTDAPDYHSVTIEVITESNNHPQSAPIYFEGQKKWVSGVMVKEAPTALKGVINTFLPKKLKSFEYSENFAAWKPVGAVDEWGNFTVKDLNFAEGQNVIAFKAESWIGNKMNQILNITLNTIPMLPSGFTPAPNSYINNNRPRIGVTFAKAAYSASPLEGIAVDSAYLTFPDGSEKDIKDDPNLKVTVSGADYDKRIDIEYLSPDPLPDGQYIARIVAGSNVGKAQALWPFTVDTTPPTVKFLPSR